MDENFLLYKALAAGLSGAMMVLIVVVPVVIYLGIQDYISKKKQGRNPSGRSPVAEGHSTIITNCPKCHTQMEAPLDLAGQTRKCTGCGWLVPIPQRGPSKSIPTPNLVEVQGGNGNRNFDKANLGIGAFTREIGTTLMHTWKHGIDLLWSWKGGVALTCVGVFVAVASILLMEQGSYGYGLPLVTKIQTRDTVFVEWMKTEYELKFMGTLSPLEELHRLATEPIGAPTPKDYELVKIPVKRKARIAVPTRYMMLLSSGLIIAGVGIVITTYRRTQSV